jgi:spoIIIJ-associated protein
LKQVTATGQTVEMAVQSALNELKTTKDRVEIKIIDEGKRGLLGIFGSRPAIVKVTLKTDPVAEAKKFLQTICDEMDIPVVIHVRTDNLFMHIDLESEKAALLIGKRGHTLNALQTLTQALVNRYTDHYMSVILDVENYRRKREEKLTELAERLAKKVAREKKPYSLEPMPSYERKIIHSALAGHPEVTTYSVGEEPKRHLVITPKN